MTRKDYVVIAAAFARSCPVDVDSEARQQWNRDIAETVRTLRADNDRFDADRFVSACKA